MVKDKRKRPVKSVGRKKIKLDEQAEHTVIDNTRKELRVTFKQKIYSKIIRKDTKNFSKQIDRALMLLGPDLLTAARKHDMCRLLQAIMKKGNSAQKSKVLQGLRDHIGELSGLKYAFHLVTKLFKYSENDQEMLAQILENTKRLIGIREGATLLDYFATKFRARRSILKALYIGNISIEPYHLSDVLTEFPATSQNIMQSMRKLVDKFFDKDLIDIPLVQYIIEEYCHAAPQESRDYIISSLEPHLVSLAATRPGIKLCIQLIVFSDLKTKKGILKSAQDLISDISTEYSYSYLFFIQLIQSIDDTKRVDKMLTRGIIQNLENFINSKTGVKFLLCLFKNPSQYLSPGEHQLLHYDSADGRKDPDLRRKELRDVLFNPIALTVQQNFSGIACHILHSQLIYAIFECLGRKEYTNKDLLDVITLSFNNPYVMNHSIGHRTLKNLVRMDYEYGILTAKIMKRLKASKDMIPELLNYRGIWALIAIMENPKRGNKAKLFFKKFSNSIDQNLGGGNKFLECLNN